MTPRHYWAIGILLVAVFAVPHEAGAFFPYIHKMSGPRMLGVSYNCKPLLPRPFGDQRESPPSSDERTVPAIGQDRCFWQEREEFRLAALSQSPHYWIRMETAVFTSVAHEADPDNRPRVWAFAPALLFEASPVHPGDGGKLTVFVGIGIEGFGAFGHQMKPVVRPALRIRPLGVRINRLGRLKAVEGSFDLRYFPTRFTNEDFGRPAGPDDARGGGEWVMGATVTLILNDFSI
jgi:hypothetical protein